MSYFCSYASLEFEKKSASTREHFFALRNFALRVRNLQRLYTQTQIRTSKRRILSVSSFLWGIVAQSSKSSTFQLAWLICTYVKLGSRQSHAQSVLGFKMVQDGSRRFNVVQCGAKYQRIPWKRGIFDIFRPGHSGYWP